MCSYTAFLAWRLPVVVETCCVNEYQTLVLLTVLSSAFISNVVSVELRRQKQSGAVMPADVDFSVYYEPVIWNR